VPTFQEDNEIIKLMEDAEIKQLSDEEQKKLEETLKAASFGLNTAMANTIKEIMEGNAK
jgi:hypothetical protein